MTDAGPNDPGQDDQGPGQPSKEAPPAWGPAPTPLSSAGAWDSLHPEGNALAAWIAEQGGAHTSAALERSALESGYTKAQFDEAVRLAGGFERERQVIKPLRWRARIIVVVGYGLVWLLFASKYLPASDVYFGGSTLQLILTMSLGIAFAISLAWIYSTRPDPDRVGRALAIMLAVPVVLLVGVAGLCLPFLPVQ